MYQWHVQEPQPQAPPPPPAGAATRFGWEGFQRRRGQGRGFAFARYKNLAAYLAVAVEVGVDHETGRVRLLRAAAAVDSGQAVSPDGLRNQVEGGIVQAASWTLYEAVTFDAARITSVDWSGYPIARFPDVPERIDVEVIDRPGEPFLGTGEAAQGPTAAAIANAIQTDVRGHAIQQARWVVGCQAVPSFEEADEDVLAGVSGLLFASQQPPAAPEHHGPVPATEQVDVRLVHAATSTPV